MKDQQILEALETLASACPWDSVDIWVRREPAGKVTFSAYVRDNPQFGFASEFGRGATPMEAVNDVIRTTGKRDPGIARDDKISELQEQIRKLEAVTIGLPPYRPVTRIAESAVEV